MASLSSQADTIPIVRLSNEDVPQEHQFDAWHQAASPLFDAVPLKPSQTYSCSVTSYLVDQLVFTHTRFDKMQFIRSMHKLSGEESDCISLQYYQSGCIEGQLDDGTPLLMQPDRISIQDFAHPYSGIGGTANNFGVLIPRHLLTAHDDLYRHSPMLSWAVNSPEGQLLNSALASIWRALPHLNQAKAPAMAAGLVGLLNGLLSTQWDGNVRTQMQETLLRAMQDYLQNHIGFPKLGVEQLCQAFHCSRATVYRLFKPAGGVKAYLKEQRLKGCYRDLQTLDTVAKPQICAIAARWGLPNSASFIRQFQKRYGIAPTEVAASQGVDGALYPSPQSEFWHDVTLLKSWLEFRP